MFLLARSFLFTFFGNPKLTIREIFTRMYGMISCSLADSRDILGQSDGSWNLEMSPG